MLYFYGSERRRFNHCSASVLLFVHLVLPERDPFSGAFLSLPRVSR